MKALYILPALAFAAGTASAEFRFRDVKLACDGLQDQIGLTHGG